MVQVGILKIWQSLLGRSAQGPDSYNELSAQYAVGYLIRRASASQPKMGGMQQPPYGNAEPPLTRQQQAVQPRADA